MDEQEFDSLKPWRPFGTENFPPIEAQLGRVTALAVALWGKTSENLLRQLLAPHPEIPPGFDLADLRELLVSAQRLSAASRNPQFMHVLPSLFYRPDIVIGSQRLTAWEAKCEILRRAIEYLENPPKP